MYEIANESSTRKRKGEAQPIALCACYSPCILDFLKNLKIENTKDIFLVNKSKFIWTDTISYNHRYYITV